MNNFPILIRQVLIGHCKHCLEIGPGRMNEYLN